MRKILKKSVGFLFAFSLSLLSFIMVIECVPTTVVAFAKPAPKVTVNKLTLYVGYNTYQIKFNHLNKNASLSFRSSKAKVAKVSREGIITPKSKGATIITVSMKQNSKKYTSRIKVAVDNPSIKIVSIPKDLKAGDTYTFKAKVKGTNSDITWSVSDKSIAVINKKSGTLTARSGGDVNVIATAGFVSISCSVTIEQLEFSVDSEDVECYEQTTVNITSEYQEGYIHFSIDDPDIIECEWGEWDGNVIPLTITPITAGSTTIRITTDGCSDELVINVTVLEEAKEITTDTDYLECSDSETINITDENDDDSCYYEIGDTSIIECEWGEWNGYTAPLTIKPKKIGSTTITITSDQAPNTIVINVDVVELPRKEISTTSTNIVCSDEITIDITDPNAGDSTLSCINGNTNIIRCEWGEWKDSSTATLIITPLKSGTATILIKSDRAPNVLVINVTSEK